MTELPPGVRDRAADPTGRCSACGHHPGPIGADCWCDCHDEVLAAEQSDEIPHWRTGELIRRINTVCAQRDQLDAENLLLREQAGDMAEELELLRAERELYRTEGLKIQAGRDALKARVDLLTASPTEGEFDSNDLRVSYYYEAGATALSEFMCGVNITHVPTGITISHHSERSQLQNKVRCYEDLKRRLAELAPSERGVSATESEAP